MTVKPTISLTDQAYEYAKALVERGEFASLSAVVQHGLRLMQHEEEERLARLEAIRKTLELRAAQTPISTEEMDERLAAWRAQRDAAEPPAPR
jgi:antitoxin ParD1/3/4